MKNLVFITMLLYGMTLYAQVEKKDTADITLNADSIITGNATLDSLFSKIPEIVVKGRRPIAKMKAGSISYDIPKLLEYRMAQNAYDALKELPGVVEINGQLRLGNKPFTLLINGNKSSMPQEQLIDLLKSMPASNVKEMNIIYAATAQYQVKGLVINIILQKTKGKNLFQGELLNHFYVEKSWSDETRVNLSYDHKDMRTYLGYQYQHQNYYFITDKKATHSLKDGTYEDIALHSDEHSNINTHQLNAGLSYQWKKNHQLDISYFGSWQNSHSNDDTKGWMSGSRKRYATTHLQNIQFNYQLPFGMKINADYTYYKTPITQLLKTKKQSDGSHFDFLNKSQQQVNRWNVGLSMEHQVHQWNINYGVNYQGSSDKNYQYHYEPGTNRMIPTLDNHSTNEYEYIANGYVGASKQFGDKLSLDCSLQAEYFKSFHWHQWTIYPVIDLVYKLRPNHLLQFSFNSKKEYPGYWEMLDMTSYNYGRYGEIQGNPALHPAVEYSTQLTYMLKNRYLFTTFYNFNNGYMQQTLYQSTQRMVEIYKYFNFNFQEEAGLQCALPLLTGNRLQLTWNVTALWQHEKNDHFWDIPFNRSKWFGISSIHSSWVISKKPSLVLNLSGMAHTSTIQGTYDLPGTASMNIGFIYKFAKDKCTLRLYCNDIFESGQVNPSIRCRGQNLSNHYTKYRKIGISFSYKIGGYKQKSIQAVDTSRLK